MEIKEKMFVRFKNNNIQYIGKIININEFREPCLKYAVEVGWYDDYIFIGDGDIVGEPSINLFDLIEVGDFLDNHCVEKIKDDTIYLNDGYFIAREDIEEFVSSVVTKEQFESCKYVIERDE